MINLSEDVAKECLRRSGISVPWGTACGTSDEVKAAAARAGGRVAVKGLVPAGRRGKAGAVELADTPEEAARAATAILGSTVSGFLVERVYVEERVDIRQELYLSFLNTLFPPRVLLSAQGGIDIEEARRADPEAVIAVELDPSRALTGWDAVTLWKRAGVSGRILAQLGPITSRLRKAFSDWDATTLELNPLAIDEAGKISVVGAMISIDANAMARQHDRLSAAGWMPRIEARNGNEREIAVAEANYRLPGGMVRYTELDGDIGLIVWGGGAGLYQHDLILSCGGRPANHSDQNGINAEKIKALASAILSNPRTKGLLVSANHQQMTRVDRKIEGVVAALEEEGVDATAFPVVIRAFGPYEDEARAIAARVDGVRYLPRGASMADACRLITELVAGARAR